MNKLTRSVFGGVAFAAPMLLAVTTPAVAHPLPHVDVATITGFGTISPGLGLTPAAQSISFTGTASGVGTDGVPFSYGCSFTGTDPAGSAGAGAGTVTGSCGPLVFQTCVFVREGVHVDVTCATTSGHTGGAYAKCVFEPRDQLPTTRYDLVCAATVAIA